MPTELFRNSIDDANDKRANAVEDAREQAAEYDSFAAAEVYVAPNGEKFVVPNVLPLDDDQQERFDQLNFNLGQCDKHPDVEIPGRTVIAKDPDGTEIRTEYPPQVIRGGFVQPYQKDRQLITPNYNAQLAEALLGEDDFKRFKAAKGKSSEFAAAVKKLSEAGDEREASDPKVSTALVHWRTYPTEIASDLSLFHRRHIREWHSGDMSSRELMELIDHLPETSAYKLARRGGDWSVEQYIQARIGEELAFSRADGSDYTPDTDLFRSPIQLHMKHAIDAYMVDAHQRNLDEMRRKRKAV